MLVVSEAVARRMSGCNPDVEKTAQPGFADYGILRDAAMRPADRAVHQFSEHGKRRDTSGSSPNQVAVYCPIAGTFGGIPAGGAHYWRADVWARVSGVDDSQVQIRAA